MYAILCLGTEPKIYGPFDDEGQADWWLDDHASHIDETCTNNVDYEDHSILKMIPSGIVRS